MGVIYVNDESHIIMNDSDIIGIVDQYCGYELSQIIGSKIVDIDEKKLLAVEKAKTDEESYLSSLESAECCLRDILDIVEEMSGYIEDSKRINKDKIWSKMQEIIKLIGNEI